MGRFVAFLKDTSGSQPFLRVPGIVLWLIIVLLGAHAVRVWIFPQDSNWLFIDYGFVPARYSHAYLTSHWYSPSSLPNPVLPFVTYMFLHGSWTHVIVNCVWLLAFGPVVARRFGSPLLVVFFLLCGAGGAAAHLALNWADANPLIGASAGISGLMAAAFRMLPVETRAAPNTLAPILSTRIIVWTLLWVGVNFVAGKMGLGTGGTGDVVAWQAHLGGYAVGLILALPFDMIARPRGSSGTES
ncbi:MAG TPA: rhomboid family intramembrane serine protease [Rhizomicrobium sp.]|nr:rhomboid family intramembrane serine protease [Rhizomicrobium sp.]